jgi:hypothetical protein
MAIFNEKRRINRKAPHFIAMHKIPRLPAARHLTERNAAERLGPTGRGGVMGEFQPADFPTILVALADPVENPHRSMRERTSQPPLLSAV